MADGKFLIGKPLGGTTTVSMTDGASNTSLILPESGTVATEAYADGKTTLVQVKAEIRTGSNLVTSPTGAIGYGNGAGGIVTQLTSKSTDVTLNKPCGQITMSNSTLNVGASAYFNVFNNLISLTDNINLSSVESVSNSQNYKIEEYVILNGAFGVKITNISGSNLSEAFKFNFIIIRGATV